MSHFRVYDMILITKLYICLPLIINPLTVCNCFEDTWN